MYALLTTGFASSHNIRIGVQLLRLNKGRLQIRGNDPQFDKPLFSLQAKQPSLVLRDKYQLTRVVS